SVSPSVAAPAATASPSAAPASTPESSPTPGDDATTGPVTTPAASVPGRGVKQRGSTKVVSLPLAAPGMANRSADRTATPEAPAIVGERFSMLGVT
ncbi:MAG TPA: hypothetical protein PLA44_07100, partial [Propionibacteriaceae bacterium]|nr:hypothetical protein [Propionibacteriaceae bacterium]